MLDFELPELDNKATKQAVEDALHKYRLYKYHAFEEREVNITASYEERLHGPTNETGDQTAGVAIYNTDTRAYRFKFCERVESAVRRLPYLERFLIEKRYMAVDAEYITDLKMYTHIFQTPISEPTYSKLRKRAFYKLALSLNIEVTKEG